MSTRNGQDIIERQVKLLKGTSRELYLRPETMFGKTKFEGYYANRQQPIIADNAGTHPESASDRRNSVIYQ